MKKIKLSNRMHAIVDDEDFIRVSKHKWNVLKRGICIHARSISPRSEKPRETVYMHRYILRLQAYNPTFVDHINGNGLDNRTINLRLCNRIQNTYNQKRKNNSSKYRGVRFIGGKKPWRAVLQINYKSVHLGYFKYEKDAANAYNIAAVKYFGKFARLNKIAI